jgi:hypothetical protein
MGGTQDIYDTYHSVKRYAPSQQVIPPPPQNNANIYPPPQNKSIQNNLNPYVCDSYAQNSRNTKVPSNNNG